MLPVFFINPAFISPLVGVFLCIAVRQNTKPIPIEFLMSTDPKADFKT
jgi:hypothetical protein